MTQAALEIIDIIVGLDGDSQAALLNVVRGFVSDEYAFDNDIATEDDIANHELSMEEYRRGECYRFKREDWDAPGAAAI